MIAEIVQELFVFVIEILVPAIRVILSCLLLDKEFKQVLRFVILFVVSELLGIIKDDIHKLFIEPFVTSKSVKFNF